MRRDRIGCILIKAAQLRDIGGVTKMQFDCQGVNQWQVAAIGRDPATKNGARSSARAFLGERCDDGNAAEDFCCLHGHELGIAGTKADAKEAAMRWGIIAHSASLASAFNAAAAMALPPLRPLTVIN